MDMNRITAEYNKGLSDGQVESQRSKGLGNKIPKTTTKTSVQIIKENVFTLFNLLNLLIALALSFVGAYANLMFLAIIAVNILIGISQEIHARNLVEKLSVVNALKVKVMRNGEEKSIGVEELVQDDVVILAAGDQIVSDAIMVLGEIEVNESLLTGESDVIEKVTGRLLYSGSFVVSGMAYTKVEHVGLENYSAKIISEAKKDRGIHSEMIDAMNTVTKFTTLIIVPLGIILFLEAFYGRRDTLLLSVVTTAAAILGMLPKGLVLLMSLSSATGVMKLAKKNVLVQDMHSMETLAHVDVLCLDKTGTLTEGKMKVTKENYLEQNVRGLSIGKIIGNYINSSEDHNATMEAMRAAFDKKEDLIVESRIPFSSDRKWSAITFKDFGSVIFGAPDRIYPPKDLPKLVKDKEREGVRVLFVGYTEDKIEKTDMKMNKILPLALLEIADPIRKHVKETLDYFKKEGVEIKIISGDSPLTVSTIAKQAGFEKNQSYVDMSQAETMEDITEAAKTYSIFGRVSPKQKKQLIMAFQVQGHTVAMTGDGVNDVLALRQADCGIAMEEGNDAAKQISELVLMDSNFESLPLVLAEGRRIINNLTKVSSVFFIKTLYSVLLSLLCVLLGIPFPFIPIQITLNDLAIEGYPAFFLSFEPNGKKVRGKFLRTGLRNALPNALIVVANIAAVYLMTPSLGLLPKESVTLMYYILAYVSILAVLRTCLPFNPLRAFLFLSVAVGYPLATFLFRGMLNLGTLTLKILPIFLVLAGISTLFRAKPLYRVWKSKKEEDKPEIYAKAA